ncbi:MAG TPA: nuclear transport factor 2 family protein, partial [Solirubrobacterales bacterium]|nr:nuclear transport factor 2 family protein [Solirubrobacterales bacterium]
GAYRGLDAIRKYMTDDFLADFADPAIAGEEFFAAGDSVVVRVRQSATGPGSGAPVEMSYYQVWSFRGASVIRIESIRDRGDALDAVGLRQ